MRYFATFDAVKQKDHARKPLSDKPLNPRFAERIEQLMRSEKPYLFADITLDILAEKLAMSSKDLSMTINRHFHNNFYEFINGFRIEEAKRILLEQRNKPITDVYQEVGFNSKSVFNTFFKKLVGVTPSQYRQGQPQPCEFNV